MAITKNTVASYSMAFWLKGGFHGTLSSPSGSATAMACFMRMINLQGTSLSPATAKFLKDKIVEVYFYSVLFKTTCSYCCI